MGGALDRDRLREEVLEKLRDDKPFSYRVFNYDTMAMDPPIEVVPKRLTVIEGAYSMHPELRKYYDITAFLSISKTDQMATILNRHGSFTLRRFVEEYIPRENAYFDNMNIQKACDFLY